MIACWQINNHGDRDGYWNNLNVFVMKFVKKLIMNKAVCN